jgi:hypothetical protein
MYTQRHINLENFKACLLFPNLLVMLSSHGLVGGLGILLSELSQIVALQMRGHACNGDISIKLYASTALQRSGSQRIGQWCTVSRESHRPGLRGQIHPWRFVMSQ